MKLSTLRRHIPVKMFAAHEHDKQDRIAGSKQEIVVRRESTTIKDAQAKLASTT